MTFFQISYGVDSEVCRSIVRETLEFDSEEQAWSYAERSASVVFKRMEVEGAFEKDPGYTSESENPGNYENYLEYSTFKEVSSFFS